MKQQQLFFAILVLCAATILSCQPETKKSNLYKPVFEHYFNFEEEVSMLERKNPLVKITSIIDGVKTNSLDEVDWRDELNLFLSSNINKQEYKDKYTVSVVDGIESKVVKYEARDLNLPIRSVELIYDNEICTSVFLKKTTTTDNGYSNYDLYYQPGVGYAITGATAQKGSNKSTFEIRGRIYDFPYGSWRATLDLGNEKLPFIMEISNQGGACIIDFKNGKEVIRADEIKVSMDSLIIRMPVFNSEIRATFVGLKGLKGEWRNYHKGKNYRIPLEASFGNTTRFYAESIKKPPMIGGQWETTFSQGTENEYKAIGKFYQEGNLVTGTFMTETGDYRYLEGVVVNDSLFLSCFDGSHAFLFKALMDKSGNMQGMFWSGNHWSEPWIATKNEEFKLTHPDSITKMKPGQSILSFSFPNLEGKTVSLSDEKYKGKVVIVNIMASWCPNCKDETSFLTELYNQYHSEGLEIIALCYEKEKEHVKAAQTVKRHKRYFNAQYEFLIAGEAKKDAASKNLPMLTGIKSFPTTVFIGRDGTVQKIHTGFYGPGTGEYYSEFVKNTHVFIEELLKTPS